MSGVSAFEQRGGPRRRSSCQVAAACSHLLTGPGHRLPPADHHRSSCPTCSGSIPTRSAGDRRDSSAAQRTSHVITATTCASTPPQPWWHQRRKRPDRATAHHDLQPARPAPDRDVPHRPGRDDPACPPRPGRATNGTVTIVAERLPGFQRRRLHPEDQQRRTGPGHRAALNASCAPRTSLPNCQSADAPSVTSSAKSAPS